MTVETPIKAYQTGDVYQRVIDTLNPRPLRELGHMMFPAPNRPEHRKWASEQHALHRLAGEFLDYLVGRQGETGLIYAETGDTLARMMATPNTRRDNMAELVSQFIEQDFLAPNRQNPLLCHYLDENDATPVVTGASSTIGKCRRGTASSSRPSPT